MIARVGGDLLRASQDFSKQVRRTWPPRVPNSTCTAMTMPHKAGRPTTPADVAGRLDVMATADQALTNELDRVDAARRRVCQATVQRLEHLLVTVCAGGRARGAGHPRHQAAPRRGGAVDTATPSPERTERSQRWPAPDGHRRCRQGGGVGVMRLAEVGKRGSTLSVLEGGDVTR